MREFFGGWLTLAAATPWYIVWAQRLLLLLLVLFVLKAIVVMFRAGKSQ